MNAVTKLACDLDILDTVSSGHEGDRVVWAIEECRTDLGNPIIEVEWKDGSRSSFWPDSVIYVEERLR
jgi:hypothetical protein